jgi:hypothetical protein
MGRPERDTSGTPPGAARGDRLLPPPPRPAATGHSWSAPRSDGRDRRHWDEDRRLRLGGFAGAGPKGYLRSDSRMREDVCDRLTADDELDARGIEVAVDHGVVTLDGSVPDRRSKWRAEDIAEQASGVRAVHNNLLVQARNEEPS